jgi:hypothetical protein
MMAAAPGGKSVSSSKISRRRLLGYAPAAAVVTTVSPLLLNGGAALAQGAASPLEAGLPGLLTSIQRAFAFQNFMMDAYARGNTVRLSQSYSDQNGLLSTGFTYDNAVAIHAYLASEDPALQKRAVILGEGLLYGQAHPYPFPIADGRFPQAFFTNAPTADGAYVTPAANPFYFYTSAVGDQAWAGMAVAQLYARTGDQRYLNAALLVGNWIAQNTYDANGVGGYKFGTVIAYINGQNVSEPSTNGKSTEHNIDTFAFFTMLAELTRDGFSSFEAMRWSELADHALRFVKAMFNPAGPYFYTGTLGDQQTINPYPIPEDVNTWSYLALLNNAYRGTIDWALAHLETTDTSSSPHSSLTGSETIHGLVFDTASLVAAAPHTDPNAVWLEGTGHMIAALIARVLRGGDNLFGLLKDLGTAAGLVQQSMKAQAELGMGQTVNNKPIPAGEGLVAATSLMDTGFGYTYGPELHIGATGWYLLGALAANPFRLGYRVVG